MANEGNIFNSFIRSSLISILASLSAIGATTDAAAVPSNTTSVISIIKKIYDLVVGIIAQFLTLIEAGGTVTTDGTEQNVYINNAPAGVYYPKRVKIDFTNHTATETVILREYYRVKSGGNLIKADEVAYVGVQDPALIVIDLKENRYGVKVTMEKTVGTNRAYDYTSTYEI